MWKTRKAEILARKIYLGSRYATKAAKKNTIKYTDTINLPKTAFPQRLNAEKRIDVQQQINKQCLLHVYDWQRQNLDGPDFVLHDGPPYANGDTHIGHAINKILKDFVLKSNIVERRRIHYVPGWDCHGLPIEMKAMAKKNHQNSLGIRESARSFAKKTIEKQKLDFKSWGVIGNWTSEIYRTFDKEYIKSQIRIFHELYKKGLIYRDLKPVYWSPSSKTALAEAELEYDENFKSPSLYIRFKLAKKPAGVEEDVYCLIWTTTPWTLPSNQAVCFNSGLNYALLRLDGSEELYLMAKDLIEAFSTETSREIEVVRDIPGDQLENVSYLHPIDGTELPFLPATHVQATKGTGLVHTAPAHGPDDFLVSLAHKIPLRNLVDEAGCYSKEAPIFLQGKEIFNTGNEAVLNAVHADVVHLDTITHSYPIDWRTKQPVIFRASHQWFIDTAKIKSQAIEEIQKVTLFPRAAAEASRNALIAKVQSRPYWCISRQRCWGVPIPVFYALTDNRPIITDATIDRICKLIDATETADFWWEQPIDVLLPPKEMSGEKVRRGEDILDIWFDSGISWFCALDGDKVADLYLEGIDQFTGWFQSSLLTSVALRGRAPYRGIFAHGFAVDEKGQKMSKSVGNVIAPDEIVGKYGIDTLRWWIAAHATQHSSIPVSRKVLEDSGEVVRKIRATLRFMNGVIGERDDDNEMPASTLSHLDRFVLHALSDFYAAVFDLYPTYQFNLVTATINNFITNEISAIYLHLIKDRLYCGDREEQKRIKSVFSDLYSVTCKAIWPILPHLIEESWSYYDSEPFYKRKVEKNPAWRDEHAAKIVKKAVELRHEVNKQIKDMNSWSINANISLKGEDYSLLKNLQLDDFSNDSELCDILQVSSIQLLPGQETKIVLNSNEKPLCPRCRRFSVNHAESLCRRCTEVLKK